MSSPLYKKIIKKTHECNHSNTEEDKLFEDARVCIDCGLVIFNNPEHQEIKE